MKSLKLQNCDAGKASKMLSVRGYPALLVMLLLLGLAALLASPAMTPAMAMDRYVNFDADPAAFGINGEAIDMTEFEVQYFSIPDDENKIGFRMVNTTQPENYVEIRGIIPLAGGETFTIDGVGAMPYITVDPSTIGSVSAPKEMPGSQPGIDNIYELDSGLLGGSQFFRLRDVIGTVVSHFDLDGEYSDMDKQVTESSVLKWNRIPSGYAFAEPLAAFQTYSSSEGEPADWG